MSDGTSGTGGGRIRTHPLPPGGFDPRAASPLELRRYGLPQRPDPAVGPELAARWDEVFSRKLSYITPVFQQAEELVPGVSRADRPRPDANGTNGTWSGAVAHAPAGETFEWVFGTWNVPDVEPGGQGPGSWYAATWIGIDGVVDVTQIGTMQVASKAARGRPTRSCFAWYEWWSASAPSPWVAIANFPVSFGDTISGLICLVSPTEANFSMVNMTTGVHVGFGQIPLTAPAGTASLENQAEWILERPQLPSGQAQLPDFSEISFASAYAGRGLAFSVEGGAADTVLNMVENGTTVATTTIETPTLIKIDYTGGPSPAQAGRLPSSPDDGTSR
jgi:Peptidase A4 family